LVGKFATLLPEGRAASEPEMRKRKYKGCFALVDAEYQSVMPSTKATLKPLAEWLVRTPRIQDRLYHEWCAMSSEFAPERDLVCRGTRVLRHRTPPRPTQLTKVTGKAGPGPAIDRQPGENTIEARLQPRDGGTVDCSEPVARGTATRTGSVRRPLYKEKDR